MQTVEDFCQFMESYAPRKLAEEWDNVGLLVGDRRRGVSSAMTCLTVTPESVQEAIAEQTDLIITHHPFPFRPLKKITTGDVVGQLLLKLIENHVAVYSPHTCFDSARNGINQSWAEGLGWSQIRPIRPYDGDADLGGGRWGKLISPQPLREVVNSVRQFAPAARVRFVGSAEQPISRVAIACGSAGDFLADARRLGCELFITGEATFHTCLEAQANGVALLLTGHYASERFAVEQLAAVLASEFAGCRVWPSHKESDPLCYA